MRRTGLLLALVLGALAACSDGSSGAAGSSASSSSTTTTIATTTSSTLRPEDEVKAAYLAYWAMVDSNVEPSDPTLSDVATDPVLAFVKDDLSSDRANGVRTQQPSDPSLNSHRIDALVVTGDTAVIRDCFIDGRMAVHLNGEVVNDAVVTKRIEATARRQEGRWRVSSVSVVSRSEGRSGCAA